MRRIDTPNNYPRLFDLIKPEYAVAFYFALRDTIVCDDEDISMEVDDDDNDDGEGNAANTSGKNGDDFDQARLRELKEYQDKEIESFELAVLEEDFETRQEERKAMKKILNVLQEYRKRNKSFDLSAAVTAVQNIYERFVNQRLDEFNTALNIINEHLRNQYYSLSLGGKAYLQSVSPMDAYSDGIKFIVRPKSKGWREIAMTSGGEKTISSLSLVFAFHQYLPTPFYVMEKIDAALDFRNVAMISKFVKEKTKNSQFIIISLRDNMYQLANCLMVYIKLKTKLKHASFVKRILTINKLVLLSCLHKSYLSSDMLLICSGCKFSW